jgi:hypothetical protein
VAQELSQGGLLIGPLPDAKSSTYPSRHIEHASARADSIDFDFDNTIDRLQKSKKVDFDETLFELARNRIASHHAKFARPENRQPSLPDDAITAQFLAVAEWPKLEGMLLDLASERKEAGHSYAWYVTVALQRIHGISPERLRKMRGRVKSETSRPTLIPGREAIPRKPAAVVEVEQLKEEIRALAAAKSIR